MELAQTRYDAAELSDLAAIRQFVEDAATAVTQNNEAVSELIIALNEAVTNIILHGYEGQPGAVEITIAAKDQRLSVRLRDQAPAFDPTSLPPPDVTLPLEQRTAGGLGVHMMHQFVDKLSYRAPASGGNELILEKVFV